MWHHFVIPLTDPSEEVHILPTDTCSFLLPARSAPSCADLALSVATLQTTALTRLAFSKTHRDKPNRPFKNYFIFFCMRA